MTYEDKASYDSTPPCIQRVCISNGYVCISIWIYVYPYGYPYAYSHAP